MFDKLFKKKVVVKNVNEVLPALSPYFHNKGERIALSKNQELVHKYDKYCNTIEYFMIEIAKYHSDEEVKNIINKYIIPLDGKVLLELMTDYLRLSADDKLSKKYFKFYDEKHNMVEISDADAKEEKMLDDKFVKLNTNKFFNNIPLTELYRVLDLHCKRYFISVLEKEECYIGLIELFENQQSIHFKSLIKLLIRKSIDSCILNYSITDEMDESLYREMVFTLMANNNVEIARYVKVLIENNRFDILNDLVIRNLLSDNIFTSTFGINNERKLSDIEIINAFERVRVKHNYNN